MDMPYTDDIRMQFYLASAFDGFKGPDRIARILANAKLGLETLGDLIKLSVPEIRAAMNEVNLSAKDQDVFLKQLRDSAIFPRDVQKVDDFKL